MEKRTRDKIIGTVAVVAAVVSLYFAFGRGSQKINLDPYEVLGAVTAEETAKLLGNKGQVLVMIPDSGAAKIPAVEAEVKSLRKTLEKQPGMSVVEERVSITPMLMLATGGGVPPEQLFKALDSHAHVGAIVLFFAFPQLTEPQLAKFKALGIKTVVFSPFRGDYPRLMEQQVIHLAISPRSDSPPAGAPAPRTLRERFDQDYTLTTPAEAARPH